MNHDEGTGSSASFNIMDLARRAVQEATKAARFVAQSQSQQVLQQDGTLTKQDKSPVTIADFAVQAVICRHLLEFAPNDPIIGEEDAKELRSNTKLLEQVVEAVQIVVPTATHNQVCEWIDRGNHREYCARFWTLDPIDGTKGFLRQEQYAICLALVVDGITTMSAMACPNYLFSSEPEQHQEASVKGTLFWASLDHGAWHAPLSEDVNKDTTTNEEEYIQKVKQQLKLQEQAKTTAQLRFCESVEGGHSNHQLSQQIASTLNITRPPLRLDSQVKYGAVARGDADIYLRLPAPQKAKTYHESIWDHACGHVLVTAAGGRVTDMHGRKLDFAQGAKLFKNQGVVVSTSPTLHSKVLSAIASCTASSPTTD